MIITKIQGGLGNQMFQYACGHALSLKTKNKLVLDTTWFKQHSIDTRREFLLSIFKTSINLAENWQIEIFNQFFKKPFTSLSDKWQKKVLKKVGLIRILEPGSHQTININTFGAKHILLNGFWQTEEYFKKYEKQIRRDFSFMSPPKSDIKFWLNKINHTNSISIHIRREDYANNPKTRAYHGLLSLKYYSSAIKLIKTKVCKPVFFVFSDDLQWVKKNFKISNKFFYVDHENQDWEDLRLMSHCQHNIIANSSFSWWGAWLNKNKRKIVIAPANWYASKSIDSSKITPQSWLKI